MSFTLTISTLSSCGLPQIDLPVYGRIVSSRTRMDQDYNFGMNYPKRKAIRLKGYDYSHPGAFFVTIVSYDRKCILGAVDGNIVRISPIGQVVVDTWQELPSHFRNVHLDQFVVMPNHIHGIIVIDAPDRVDNALEKVSPLSEMVRIFKSYSTRRIHNQLKNINTPVWQRNYYEHIIRDENEWNKIRVYIETNPLRWSEDPENTP